MTMRNFAGIANPKSPGDTRAIKLASILRALAENTWRTEFSNTLISDLAPDAGRQARPTTPDAGVIFATSECGLNRLGFKLAIPHHKKRTR